MNLQQFKQTLADNPELEIQLKFASGDSMAPHFHITEIGKVTKDFVDCGGTRRVTEACVLQTLVANDTDHRLTSDKLSAIFARTDDLGFEGYFPVEAEVQVDTIAIYLISSGKNEDGKLVFELTPKNTACLAPDACGLEVIPVTSQTADSPQQMALETSEDSECCGGGDGGG